MTWGAFIACRDTQNWGDTRHYYNYGIFNMVGDILRREDSC